MTPWLRYFASITLWDVAKNFITSAVFLGMAGVLVWRLFIVKQWVADVEYEGNVDADKALEGLDEGEEANKNPKKGDEDAEKD